MTPEDTLTLPVGVPVARPRVTVTGAVYHQAPGEQPTVAESRHGWMQATDEAPYQRPRLMVGPGWQSLDCGWLTAASLLVLRNDEGQFTQTIPSEEDRASALARVVEIGIVAPDPLAAKRTMHDPPGPSKEPVVVAVVRPGRDCRFEPPADLSRLRVRCLAGSARCTLTLYPV